MDLCVATGIDPPDAQKEKEGIAALQAEERQVDHSVSDHIVTEFSVEGSSSSKRQYFDDRNVKHRPVVQNSIQRTRCVVGADLHVFLFTWQWIIIPLLSSAVAQFKKYKSPRMKRQLSKLLVFDRKLPSRHLP